MYSTCSAMALAMAGTLALAAPAHADADATNDPITVVADKPADTIAPSPGTAAHVDAATIARTINAVSVEDTLKYVPSLIIRKRSIGDNYAPIATRTSGLSSSARSLIYADGAPLSALIANNNGSGSPRWSLVTPAEIESIDVLYGPFSAAYPGNSIGTVVNITTRMPDHLEAGVSALSSLQHFRLYGTDATLPSGQVSAWLGDRFGPLSLYAAFTRTVANTQPISFVTATALPAGTTGGYSAQNKTGAAIKVLGASGIEHHIQNTAKLKAALDLSDHLRLAYTLGIWTDDTQGHLQSYLASASTGQAAYTSGFSSGLYTRSALHLSHVASLRGDTPKLDWQLIGTLYDYARDRQNTSGSSALPAFGGGAGTILRQDGTGWVTLDAKAARHFGNDAQVLSLGAHADRYTLNYNTYSASNWLDNGTQGALASASRGKTRTLAVWAQDAVSLAPAWLLTLGGRYEWWRASDGWNYSASPALSTAQPSLSAQGFSPKATLAWKPAAGWQLRASFGQALRFPTVGELYQAVTTGTVLSVPDPHLKPERARSEELAIERSGRQGMARISFFNEVIDNALVSQSATLVAGSTTLYTYVQNVPRTRARGVEIALNRANLWRHWDLSGSLTYADAITSADPAYPSAQGKQLPGVPRWKANALVTWHPDDHFALTGALRYASRHYANIDDSDTVGNTYGGFYQYLVVDLKAQFRVNDHFTLSLGVDNLNNDKYFLYHPFPQRTLTAQASWTL